jgi:methylmalonyl-CoA mutase N-terminal domain/subunit
VSGYHIREAGATAAEELAFTLADGIEYVAWGVRAGLAVDAFAPRMSFFFNAHSDFFEEIAKYRAARRIWARVMRERFGATDERSWKLRFHTQTAGVSLTAQQPYNNVVRTALQALAAVIGGSNSLHTNALDEALALPTEDAARLALRTQQILAHETGLTSVVDPLGGSWCLERLTADMETEAVALIERIDQLGGMVGAVEAGLPQRVISDSAYAFQRAVETGERVTVGVNAYVDDGAEPVPTLSIDPRVAARQIARTAEVRARRDPAGAARALTALEDAARGPQNLMPPLVDAARAGATVGEMTDVLRRVWGEYEESPAI